MSTQMTARLGVLFVLLAAFLGMSTQAQAAPQKATAGYDFVMPQADPSADPVAFRVVNGQLELAQLGSASADDVVIQASHTFSRANTERIYTAARVGGSVAVGALCVAIAPGFVKAICPVFVAVVMSYVPTRPPAGRCLKVSTKFGWPPLKVEYVSC